MEPGKEKSRKYALGLKKGLTSYFFAHAHSLCSFTMLCIVFCRVEIISECAEVQSHVHQSEVGAFPNIGISLHVFRLTSDSVRRFFLIPICRCQWISYPCRISQNARYTISRVPKLWIPMLHWIFRPVNGESGSCEKRASSKETSKKKKKEKSICDVSDQIQPAGQVFPHKASFTTCSLLCGPLRPCLRVRVSSCTGLLRFHMKDASCL